MGLTPVCHTEGGFSAWKKARAPMEAVEAKTPHGAKSR
jgi:3-mercaptopyruvate sulfurtransferase SseA